MGIYEFKNVLNTRLFDFNAVIVRDDVIVIDPYLSKGAIDKYHLDDLILIRNSNHYFTDRAKNFIKEIAKDNNIKIVFDRQEIIINDLKFIWLGGIYGAN